MASRPRKKPKHPKTISASGITGQKGVNAIERVILDMGSRWTPSGPNEVGIDGYIELFDPSSRRPLGLTFAVQSKVATEAVRGPGPSFDYWCDPNDVVYWLRGNTPVIVAVSDGTPEAVYWISVQHYFKDWKPGSPARVCFDKSKHRLALGSIPQLVEIAAPKTGLYLAPSRKNERLLSNLLVLEGYPPTMCVAATECRTPRDVWAALRNAPGDVDAGWILWEKKLFSFHVLSKTPCSCVCDLGTLEEFSTNDWAESLDPQRQRIFVQLLNQTLRAQLDPHVRFWPKEDCYALLGPPRQLQYQAIQRPSKITVVSRFSSKASDGRRFEWFRHMAFRGQFRMLSNQWFLGITPTYRFTTDGFNLDPFHEERLKGIKRLEGNRAVLSSVMFWSNYLRPKAGLFKDAVVPLQFGELASFNNDVGIIDKEWLAKDPGTLKAATAIAQQLHLPDPNEGNES
jgi:hypothetical protein